MTTNVPTTVLMRTALMGAGQSDWRGTSPVTTDDPMENAVQLAAAGRYTGFRFERQNEVVLDGETFKGPRVKDDTVYRFGREITFANICDLGWELQRQAGPFLLKGGRLYMPYREFGLVALAPNEVALDVIAEAIRRFCNKP